MIPVIKNEITEIKILLFVALFLFCADGYCAKEEESALFWPPPPAEIRLVFVKSIYQAADIGVRPGLFKKLKRLITGEVKALLSKPLSVAVDSQAIYVCDPGSRAVHIFQQKEKTYKKISQIKNEELASPVGVAVSSQGLIFITDSKLRKVFCLDKEGKFKFSLGVTPKFLRPSGLSIHKDRLYVVDTAAHSIFIFDLKGNFISQFGKRGKKEGEFNYPTGITVDNAGNVYIVDTLNFRVQVFDKDNEFLYSIGQLGDSSGSFSRPKAVAVDSFGHIYVTDGLFDNLQIFGQDKKFLLSLGESGNKDGEFWLPCGVAIDSNNYIYVADSYNQRIQVFQYIGKE